MVFITRFLFIYLCFFAVTAAYAVPVQLSPQDVNIARKAIYQADKKLWAEARYTASEAKDKVIRDYVFWLQLMEGANNYSFDEVTGFLKRNPNWPDLRIIERRAEVSLNDNVDAKKIIEWFADRHPVTGKGKQFLAKAKLELGHGTKDEITTLLRAAWIHRDFTDEEQAEFLRSYKSYLREEDYITRIDRLLWDRNIEPAKRLLNRVDEDHRKLFTIRISQIQKNPADFSQVPSNLRSNPGLIFDQILLLHKEKNREEKIISLLKLIDGDVVYPNKVWEYRARYIREALTLKDYKSAYEIAKNHGLVEGEDFADGEWLSGWIALRFLNDAKTAYKHFYRLYEGTKSSVSVARAAYWAGRAAEDNDNPDIAHNWYEAASQYATVFYGQLALLKIGEQTLTLPSLPEPTAEDKQKHRKNNLIKIFMILHQLDEDPLLVRKFLTAAANSTETPGEALLLSQLGKDLHRLDFSVIAAKTANQKGVFLIDVGYPKPSIISDNYDSNLPEKALIYAITRQESEFYEKAKSSAGALGLMQLLPSTAKKVASKMGQKVSPSELTSNKKLNVTLGSHYLKEMLGNYDNSYILAIASYNAGPGNVKNWLHQNGNPRKIRTLDKVIDWIELIPFKETRNYVQRVLENTQIYRSQLSSSPSNALLLEHDLLR